MIDTTTPRDLAAKIEWIGYSNLSKREKVMVGKRLEEVSAFLPRLLALVMWKAYDRSAPFPLKTRSSEESVQSLSRRNRSREFVRSLMEGVEAA